ncbi:MAG: hypothetical protein JW913_14875 [Chitinispirillaceae bacterium]|nr:hypothetical protein [Chitinispirillaceae bacterium]
MRFGCTMLGAIDATSPEAAEEALADALDVGILQYAAASDIRNAPREFRFSHDRIREAIYNRIDPEERTRLHLLIGRSLLRRKQRGTLNPRFLILSSISTPFTSRLPMQRNAANSPS